MVVDIKTYGVLLIDEERASRSYYSLALNTKGIYRTYTAANYDEVQSITQSTQRDDISFIIINSNLKCENYYNSIQKLRNKTTTFLADVILISNDVDEETKYLLNELYIKEIFPEKTEAQKIILFLDKLREEKKYHGIIQDLIYELNFSIKNKDVDKCREIMENEKIKSYFKTSKKHSSLYGEYLILTNKFKECHDFLKDILKHHYHQSDKFETVSILNCLAKSLCHLEKHDEALIIYNEMVAKSPKNFNHKINLSTVHIAKGQWQQALNMLDFVIKVDPKNKTALLNSAQAHVALGNTKEAELLINKIAGTVDSSFLVSFFNNRGVAFAHKHEYQKALEFYRNAIFFGSKDVTKIFFNIGLSLLKSNRIKEAEKIFDELKNSDDYNLLYENKSVLQNLLKK